MPAIGTVKRVAVIGAGPAGAITIDALAKEEAFDAIRVFERREAPGGCWLSDDAPPPVLSDFESLASRTADAPLDDIPALSGAAGQPVRAKRPKRNRWTEPHIYPYLETNVSDVAMQFSGEPIAAERSARSVALHGADTPFRHWDVLRRYVDGLVRRYENGGNDEDDAVVGFSYNTTVERVEKVGNEWKVTLRKEEEGEDDGEKQDKWWVEWFDAVVVASGHYSVPYIPAVEGLEEMQGARPGSVLHSKHYRGRDAYRDKNVVVVGASVSAADIAFDLAEVAASTHAVVIGHTMNRYFGDGAFHHPRIHQCPSIKQVTVSSGPTSATPTAKKAQVELIDGSVIPGVDHIIFGTGFSWTLPFFAPSSPPTSSGAEAGVVVPTPTPTVRNNRVPDLWQHVVWRHDPTLLFVGAVGAGLTFKIFEWQAVLAARLLSDRLNKALLPTGEDMARWEAERVAARGDGAGFTLVHPDFEDYFETLRALAGEGAPGLGRKLPPFDRAWIDAFAEGHELRKRMWERLNAEAAARLEGEGGDAGQQPAENARL